MLALYKEHVLGEKKQDGFVPLNGLLASANTPAAPASEKREEVGAMGD